MSLDTVVEDIRDQARARADEIRAEADSEAEAIISEAEREADEIREEVLAEADRTIEQEREQRLSSAKLEAKQDRLEARREVLESVRSDIEDEIAGLEGDEREELTRALLEAAVAEFENTDAVTVRGRPEDEELLESLADEFDVEYGGEFDCLGGVVAESTESRVRIKNTFDSILDDVWERELREISDVLFEQ